MVSQSVHHHQSMIIMIWLCPKTEKNTWGCRDTGGTGLLLSFLNPYLHQLATFEGPPVPSVPSVCRSYPIPKGVSSPAQSPTTKMIREPFDQNALELVDLSRLTPSLRSFPGFPARTGTESKLWDWTVKLRIWAIWVPMQLKNHASQEDCVCQKIDTNKLTSNRAMENYRPLDDLPIITRAISHSKLLDYQMVKLLSLAILRAELW